MVLATLAVLCATAAWFFPRTRQPTILVEPAA